MITAQQPNRVEDPEPYSMHGSYEVVVAAARWGTQQRPLVDLDGSVSVGSTGAWLDVTGRFTSAPGSTWSSHLETFPGLHLEAGTPFWSGVGGLALGSLALFGLRRGVAIDMALGQFVADPDGRVHLTVDLVIELQLACWGLGEGAARERLGLRLRLAPSGDEAIALESLQPRLDRFVASATLP
ncbi:MAG TPA: hypothetical protein VM262_14015 [Acidimicrobiales bacterium]|nr:hypothetical protein [Acidimicrobiales bacterium]